MPHCKATEVGKIGKQTIEDTSALTKKRMETIDDETSAAAIAEVGRGPMQPQAATEMQFRFRCYRSSN